VTQTEPAHEKPSISQGTRVKREQAYEHQAPKWIQVGIGLLPTSRKIPLSLTACSIYFTFEGISEFGIFCLFLLFIKY